MKKQIIPLLFLATVVASYLILYIVNCVVSFTSIEQMIVPLCGGVAIAALLAVIFWSWISCGKMIYLWSNKK